MDLAEEHKGLFALCLEDWSDEAREAGPKRAAWVDRFLARGLRAKIALDDSGNAGGIIQYLPAEQSFIDGPGLHFIPCVWVHGYKTGRGNFQGRGMGSALLEEAEADARRCGALGMAAWGLWLPFWMRASWFRRHGYRKADRRGIMVLVWKPFHADAKPPKWLPAKKHVETPLPGKVLVSSYTNGWCMAGNLANERARRAAAEFGDRVAFREIDVSEPSVLRENGISDALFIDGREVRTGPPPSLEKIRKLIAKRVRKL